MVRICFNRKNKTLRAVFCTKLVLKMLEENLKTYFSLHNMVSVKIGDPYIVAVV